MAPKRKRTDILESLADIERRLPAVRADSIAAAALAEDVSRRIYDADFETSPDTDTDTDTDNDLGRGSDKTVEYHKAGVRLWNTVLRLELEVPPLTLSPTPEYREYLRLLVKCRVLGLCVLEAGFGETLESCSESKSRCIYLYKIAIRTAKALAEVRGVKEPKEPKEHTHEDMRLIRLVLEKSSRYQGILSKKPSTDEEQHDGQWNGNKDDIARRNTTVKHLNQERLILELAQLWREKRYEDAEELFQANMTRTDLYKFGASREIQEELTAALFNHGKLLLAQKDCAGAREWLMHASLCFDPYEQDRDDARNTNPRKAVMHALALASLGLESREGLCEAQKTVTLLASYPGGEHDYRVHILQLQLYDSPLAESFQAKEYAAVLLKMIASFQYTAEEFALLHHHIQKLHSKSPGLGCEVLDKFMLEMCKRVNNGQRISKEWMEKLIITRVWLLAHQRQTMEELDAAQAIMSKVHMAISADAAAAAQTLMWKRIEQGYQEKQYAAATRWCRLALSHMFEAGGQSNRPLIERKLLLCAVESGDLEAAKTTYAKMSEAVRDEPMTKYLVYKLAIQLDDLALAAECLRCISMSAEKKELLHACVLHARHVEQPLFVAQALKKLADSINRDNSYDFGEASLSAKDSLVYTPAIFRCTILLLRDIIDSNCGGNDGTHNGKIKDTQNAVRDLLGIFQGVIDAAEKDRDYPVPDKQRLFSAEELEWFCRAAYNIGLKHCGTWELRQTMGLLKSCIMISDILASQPTKVIESTKKMASKRLACRFLIASGLAALVRSTASAPTALSDAKEEQMVDDCHTMREHIRAFYCEFSEAGSSLVGAGYSDKLAVLLVFDFEGAIRLGEWDELEIICARTAECGTADTLRVLGDTLLRAQATVPSQVFVSTMRLVVEKLHAASHFGNDKLVRYYRCLFQSALYRDNDAAFEVLEEVGQLVGAGSQAGRVQGSPDLGESRERRETREIQGKQAETSADLRDELEYMATIAFNEGVDWFAGGSYGQSRQWASAAIRLAEMCGDNGKLKGRMESRFATLGIDAIESAEPAEAEATDVKTCIEALAASSPARVVSE